MGRDRRRAAADPKLTGLTGGYLYAKTTALAAKGRVDEARARLAELARVADAVTHDDSAGLNRVTDVLAVAVLCAKARIALAEDKAEEAITMLGQAVAKEDRLAYSEPADWFFPVRHVLGAVLVRTGRAADAEAVYREDLTRNPNNGWALYGLVQALRMQGRGAEAQATQQQFDAAWRNADVQLVASAF